MGVKDYESTKAQLIEPGYAVPRWRMPFPTYPTMTGRRPVSRRVRAQMWADLKRSNRRRLCLLSSEELSKRWVALQRPCSWGAWHMQEHARLMSLTPEQAARDGLDD